MTILVCRLRLSWSGCAAASTLASASKERMFPHSLRTWAVLSIVQENGWPAAALKLFGGKRHFKARASECAHDWLNLPLLRLVVHTVCCSFSSDNTGNTGWVWVFGVLTTHPLSSKACRLAGGSTSTHLGLLYLGLLLLYLGLLLMFTRLRRKLEIDVQCSELRTGCATSLEGLVMISHLGAQGRQWDPACP